MRKMFLFFWNTKLGLFLLGIFVLVLVSFVFTYPERLAIKKRVDVAEGMALTISAKSASAEFYEKHKRFPHDNVEAGLPDLIETTKEAIKSIEIREGGIIKITYNEKLKYNAVLTLKAQLMKEEINWICFKNDKFERIILRKDLPRKCRNQIYEKIE